MHFDPDVRGDFSFEDAEALFCEGKDALLSKRGDRRREFKTALYRAFGLEDMPLTVAGRGRHRIVNVDLDPAKWSDAYFEALIKKLRTAKALLDADPS